MKQKISKTKAKMTQVLSQAKESLKLLETLEKETMKRAKTIVNIPMSGDRKKLTNDKILASLKKIGVASEEDVESLRIRVEKLEAALASKAEGTGAIPQG